MKKIILILVGLFVCGSAMAALRAWVFNDGKSIEAEFVAYSGGQISLKTAKGKIKKVPVKQFLEEDLLYIELMSPPKLDLSFGKTSTQRTYPPTYNIGEFPRQTHYTFSSKIKQTSSKIYSQALNVELFIIGEENYGEKNVLYYYEKEEFYMPEGTRSSHELKTEKVTITEYTLNGVLRGEAFDGYMIIVTDSQGKIVASKATKDEWLGLADNLRNLPVKKTFDANGKRTTPSRPPRFY